MLVVDVETKNLFRGALAPSLGVYEVKPYGPWRGFGPRGAYARSSHMFPGGALAREGAYTRSSHMFPGGDQAPTGGVDEV